MAMSKTEADTAMTLDASQEQWMKVRKTRARRTAMIAGGFAVAVFVLSIVQMLKV